MRTFPHIFFKFPTALGFLYIPRCGGSVHIHKDTPKRTDPVQLCLSAITVSANAERISKMILKGILYIFHGDCTCFRLQDVLKFFCHDIKFPPVHLPDMHNVDDGYGYYGLSDHFPDTAPAVHPLIFKSHGITAAISSHIIHWKH